MTEPRPQAFDAVWAWRHSPPLSIAAFGAVALAIAGLAVPGTLVLRALFAATPAALEAKSEEKRQAEQQAGVFSGYVSQIDGRSLFIVPAPPMEEVAEETAVETTPTAPTRYSGPNIIATVNGAVWFSDGSRRAVGEPEKDGLAVVSLNAPWDIGVRWRGVEFTVPIFERDSTVMPREKKPGDPVVEPVPDEPSGEDEPAETKETPKVSTVTPPLPVTPPEPIPETPEPKLPEPEPVEPPVDEPPVHEDPIPANPPSDPPSR